MNTLLAPIEKPAGLPMKLVYYFTKKQFGKVMTPLKVFGARMPLSFGMFYGKIAKLDKQMTIPAELTLLLRQQISRINICAFCIDANRSVAIKTTGVDERKFDALDTYESSRLFSDAEKAALAYVSELTAEKKVNGDTFARLSRYYNERQICEIVYVVASEHVYNMTNIGLNIHSDMLCEIPGKKRR